MTDRNPWWWIPTLYFAEGIPYFIVNNISVIMFNNMGMSKGDMAWYTGMLYLPWVIKPLWSPFVDIIKTKRWWVMLMQILMSAAFVLLALSLPHPSPEVISSDATPVPIFKLTLILFWITAFASATHDIAADGFYMLALKPKEQSVFVGIRSTFYRLSSIFGQGVLVVIAGLLEKRRFTMYPGFDQYLNGAKYSSAPAESDGNIVTGKGPGAVYAFAGKLAGALDLEKECAELFKGMFVEL